MAHAKYSPSGASRWIACPGSVSLEEGFPDSSSEFADEGSAAHFLASTALTEKNDAKHYINRKIAVYNDREEWVQSDCPKDARIFTVNPEMVENVQVYIDIVRYLPGDLYIEQKYGIGHLTGEADAKGTADAVIIHEGKITIVDLKYGRGVKVEAEGNYQLGMYAAAAIEHWSFCEEFHSVELVICQPRINHLDIWDTDIEWIDMLTRNVDLAVRRSQESEPEFVPGGKQCKFCKAKAACPALTNHVMTVIADDFVDIEKDIKPQIANAKDRTVDNALLGNLMASLDLIEDWCKAIRGRTEAELFAGKEVPGYKLVEGRRGSRRWNDANGVETLMKSMRIKTDVMYDRTLISPTTAERLAKSGEIGPRQWPQLKGLISQSEGKPSVAPATDKRRAISITAEDDFDAMTDDEALGILTEGDLI